MQHRPQHPVGEAVVVFLIILFREIGHDVIVAVAAHRARLDLVLRGHAPAPAEPHAAVMLQRCVQRDFQSTRMGPATGVGHGNPIRDYEDACQYVSSQLRDRRTALKIKPAME